MPIQEIFLLIIVVLRFQFLLCHLLQGEMLSGDVAIVATSVANPFNIYFSARQLTVITVL